MYLHQICLYEALPHTQTKKRFGNSKKTLGQKKAKNTVWEIYVASHYKSC